MPLWAEKARAAFLVSSLFDGLTLSVSLSLDSSPEGRAKGGLWVAVDLSNLSVIIASHLVKPDLFAKAAPTRGGGIAQQ